MSTRRQSDDEAADEPQIAFAPPGEQLEEETEIQRLVTAFQAGDKESFGPLYARYYDRVFGYLRVLLNDRHRAEDVAQQAFLQAFEALPAYERRGKPFSAWLFTVVRNCALMVLRKEEWVDVMDPAEIDRRREAVSEEDILAALSWITDTDLAIFLERLSLPQRQAILPATSSTSPASRRRRSCTAPRRTSASSSTAACASSRSAWRQSAAAPVPPSRAAPPSSSAPPRSRSCRGKQQS